MDDYKRGLLDMLDALTVTEHNGVFALHSQDLDLRKSLNATIIAALKYRNELAERAKLDEAVKLLESNGYLVSPAHLITEYEKAVEYLRKGGWPGGLPARSGLPARPSAPQSVCGEMDKHAASARRAHSRSADR